MKASKTGSVLNVFSRRTLEEFEDASASIPLRQIDRAFEGAGIRLGEDSGGSGGARRTQFRRYVAGVNQHDPQQVDRLGNALGALIDQVATSKVEFLVRAAERDGFFFADRVFRPAGPAASSFAVAGVEDLAAIDDRGRRLRLLASDSPAEAIGGAKELAESVCRTVLRLVGEPVPGKTASLVDVVELTITALERVPADSDDANDGAALIRECLRQVGALVSRLGELRNVEGSGHGQGAGRKGLSPRHARLAVNAAIAFAGFVAETYVEQRRAE